MKFQVSIGGDSSGKDTLKPKVTIGICVRNCEVYLRDAIQSIMKQDYPHDRLELVFVDDGSEDGTLSIIERHALDSDILVKVFHTSWMGLGHARNLVITNAEGDYILWVDGDMVLTGGFVKKLVRFMEQHPEIGIAKGRQALEPGPNLPATLETYARAGGRLVNYRSEKMRLKSLGTGGSIYRVEAIKESGRFDEGLKGYGEDQDIEIRIRAAGWLLDTVDAQFLDYERYALKWNDLWRRYWLRGYYTHYFLHKNRGYIKLCYMIPPIAFFSGLIISAMLYRLTHRIVVFLLPLEYVFKMASWNAGYTRSHFDSYEPSNS